MKRKVFLLLLLINGLYLSAQNRADNLEKYYSNIWQAERYILKDDYKKAAAYYQKAFKHKAWVFQDDYYNAKYCYRHAGRADSAYLDTKYIYKHSKWIDIVEEIKKDDQRERLNDTLYDKSLQTDTAAVGRIYRRMGHQDSINLVRFKELMTEVDVFDESIIPYTFVSNLFNHWFMRDSAEMDFFLPIALNAVYKGTLHPSHYVDMASIRKWRYNPIGTISDYGMNYLTIYRKGITACGDSCVYLAFSYNQNNEQWLKEVNKRRKAIFLQDVKSQAITDFLLWTKWYANSSQLSTQYNIMARPQFIYPLNEDKFDILLKKLLDKTPNLDYYLSGSHDFDIK